MDGWMGVQALDILFEPKDGSAQYFRAVLHHVPSRSEIDRSQGMPYICLSRSVLEQTGIPTTYLAYFLVLSNLSFHASHKVSSFVRITIQVPVLALISQLSRHSNTASVTVIAPSLLQLELEYMRLTLNGER